MLLEKIKSIQRVIIINVQKIVILTSLFLIYFFIFPFFSIPIKIKMYFLRFNIKSRWQKVFNDKDISEFERQS